MRSTTHGHNGQQSPRLITNTFT